MKRITSQYKTVSVRLPANAAEHLRDEARRQHRSVSGQIAAIVAERLEQREEAECKR